MFAKIHKLRTMGVLDEAAPPAESAWSSGILEFSRAAGDGEHWVARRLILRHAMANPGKGVLLELYRPEVVDVKHPHLRVRGIEPTALGTGTVSAMVQEWLVAIG